MVISTSIFTEWCDATTTTTGGGGCGGGGLVVKQSNLSEDVFGGPFDSFGLSALMDLFEESSANPFKLKYENMYNVLNMLFNFY